MDIRTFFSEAKIGNLERLYLLHGEEEYGKDRAVEAIKKNIDHSVLDFNLDVLVDCDAATIISACSTLPMMSKKRVVLCCETSAFKKSEGDAEKLKDYIGAIPDTTCLVFCERSKVDERKLLYKAISKTGKVVLFNFYSEKDAVTWAKNYAKDNGRLISNAVAMEIISMAGVELNNLSDEMSKLCAYCDKEIDIDSVKNIIKAKTEYTVFEILESFISRNNARAIKLLNISLEDDGVGAAMQLLSFFASRIKNMLIAKRVIEKGGSAELAAKTIGGNAYAAKKSVEAARKFNKLELEDAVLILYAADKEIKSGKKGAREALQDALMEIFAQR